MATKIYKTFKGSRGHILSNSVICNVNNSVNNDNLTLEKKYLNNSRLFSEFLFVEAKILENSTRKRFKVNMNIL